MARDRSDCGLKVTSMEAPYVPSDIAMPAGAAAAESAVVTPSRKDGAEATAPEALERHECMLELNSPKDFPSRSGRQAAKVFLQAIAYPGGIYEGRHLFARIGWHVLGGSLWFFSGV